MILSDAPSPIINSTTPDGVNEEVRFSVAGLYGLRVTGLWGSENGEIVAAGNTADDPRHGPSFIARIGRDRNDVAGYIVKEIAIAAMTVGPGGVIWAVGASRDKETGDLYPNVLCRFSPDGKLLASRVLDLPPPSKFPSQLQASSDRVVWLTNANRYLEFGTDGFDMLNIAGPGGGKSAGKLAITQANTVVISRQVFATRKEPGHTDIWTLNRISEKWEKSEAAGESFPLENMIYGFDGNTLMTSGRDVRGQLLVRYTLSETK